jgi:hypothetical protein
VFHLLQALPKRGGPLSKWRDPNDAYVEISKELRGFVARLRRR